MGQLQGFTGRCYWAAYGLRRMSPSRYPRSPQSTTASDMPHGSKLHWPISVWASCNALRLRPLSQRWPVAEVDRVWPKAPTLCTCVCICFEPGGSVCKKSAQGTSRHHYLISVPSLPVELLCAKAAPGPRAYLHRRQDRRGTHRWHGGGACGQPHRRAQGVYVQRCYRA